MLLLSETEAAGFQLDRQAETVAAIRRTLDQASDRFGMRALISGPAVFAADASARARAEAGSYGVIACGLVIALLVVAFRSLPVVLLAALPLGTGILAGMCAVLLSFGSIHGITLAFGATLVGVAIDYPLHLFGHAGSQEPLDHAASRIWRPLRLGLITTVLAYAAMATGALPGLVQLSVFAGAGLLAAGYCTRYVVPAFGAEGLTASGARLRTRLPADGGRWWRIARLVVLIAAAAGALHLAYRGPGLFERDLARLSPVPDEARQLDAELRAALGVPDLRHVVVLEGERVEAVLQASEALEPKLRGLRATGAIGGYELPSHYLPSAATQQSRQASLPAAEQLAATVADTLRGLPFRPESFAPFVEAVDQTRRLAPVSLADLAETPLATRLETLLSQQDGRWFAFAPLVAVTDPAAVERAVLAELEVSYIDLKRSSERAVNGFRDRALGRLAIGVGVIFGFLAIGLGSLSRAAAVVGALLLGLVMTASLLSLMGERLALFHIVGGLLVVGLGVDYGVFFAWSHDDPERRARTLGVVILCALSTVSVFGVMATSGIVVLHAIGITVAPGTLVAFTTALVLIWPWSSAGGHRLGSTPTGEGSAS